MKINAMASNWNNRAFLEVCLKPGDLAKRSKDGDEVLNVFLVMVHKDGRIIRIKGSPHDGAPPTNLLKKLLLGC